jgi:hypothetical protein
MLYCTHLVWCKPHVQLLSEELVGTMPALCLEHVNTAHVQDTAEVQFEPYSTHIMTASTSARRILPCVSSCSLEDKKHNEFLSQKNTFVVLLSPTKNTELPLRA